MSLKDMALEARQKAYAPYSNFNVGAAIKTTSGATYSGCNVENVAYPEGTCAEAGAIAAMVMGGETKISEVYVVADAPAPVPPCGGCRQKLAEFSGSDVSITMATLGGEELTMRMDELLPGAFTQDHMENS